MMRGCFAGIDRALLTSRVAPMMHRATHRPPSGGGAPCPVDLPVEDEAAGSKVLRELLEALREPQNPSGTFRNLSKVFRNPWKVLRAVSGSFPEPSGRLRTPSGRVPNSSGSFQKLSGRFQTREKSYPTRGK